MVIARVTTARNPSAYMLTLGKNGKCLLQQGPGHSETEALGDSIAICDLLMQKEGHFPQANHVTILEDILCDWLVNL